MIKSPLPATEVPSLEEQALANSTAEQAATRRDNKTGTILPLYGPAEADTLRHMSGNRTRAASMARRAGRNLGGEMAGVQG
ncbi:hypothetical protein [Umezawaea sp.]|uniref:hypothetical protein n=1 Tax=Umezawaea sp. TaxID=1955258 RepID=UPI002ED5BC67